MAIKSFRDHDTEQLWLGNYVRRFQAIAERALNRMLLLDVSESLEQLRAIRGNRLEALSGDRKGQFSIRINDQYRLCFEWKVTDAYNVEVSDHYK